jgi:CTP:molybdopterin cytidylyltransferase MocA
VVEPIVVVSGHAAEQIHEILRHFRVHVVHNEAYASGEMVSSVKRGVSAVLEFTPPVDAYFIALVDQPRVSPATISAMCDAWTKSRPVVLLPTFNGKHGHPILAATQHADEILALPPQATLKAFTSRHTEHTLELAVNDPAILQDLDTPAEFERAARAYEAQHEDHKEHEEGAAHVSKTTRIAHPQGPQ